MAKRKAKSLTVVAYERTIKRTSMGRGRVKTSSMNKHKRRSYKAYNRQGSPS